VVRSLVRCVIALSIKKISKGIRYSNNIYALDTSRTVSLDLAVMFGSTELVNT
jgi:hypothetical protein